MSTFAVTFAFLQKSPAQLKLSTHYSEMAKKKYIPMVCAGLRMEIGSAILAESVIERSTVSSVGQEIGTEETFTEGDFVNTSWETGIE